MSQQTLVWGLSSLSLQFINPVGAATRLDIGPALRQAPLDRQQRCGEFVAASITDQLARAAGFGQFSSAHSVHYAEGRARKMAQVSASMRTTGQRRSDQEKVWEDISAKSARFKVTSEASAMSDIYEHEGSRLEDYVSSFSVLEGQSSAVFAIGGRVVGLELFDSAETLRKLFPKLLRSYGLDALDRARSESSKKEISCTPLEAGAFLKSVSDAKAEEFPAVGEGMDIRLSGSNLTGAALAADDHIIHLSAFSMGD